MRVVALVSGGKDSCYNMLECVAAGHEIVALANLRPVEVNELDSYMYQTVGHDAIDLYSDAMGLPLYRDYIKGTSILQGSDYEPTDQEDEVEDLYRLLSTVKNKEHIEAVAVGAILSNYQRVRVENVCSRLGLTSLSYLWQRDQEELLAEMIACGIKAVIIKVAALGLTPEKHLGKTIQECQAEFSQLKNKYGLNVCGEGGEYETLTLDCPLFKEEIKIVESKIVYHSNDPFAPVAYLTFPKLCLVSKDSNQGNFLEIIKRPLNLSEVGVSVVHSDVKQSEDFENVEPFGQITGKYEESFTIPFSCNRSASGVLFVSGLCARSMLNLEHAMGYLSETLKNNGSDMAHVVSVTVYIRDIAEFSNFNSVYAQSFCLNPPARACVEVPQTFFAVIEAIAIDSEIKKRNMHVQSISHWAPANIGPYSQCVQIGKLLMVSGQIGLIPGSMELPAPSNFTIECSLALRNISRILHAMNPGITLANSIQTVCFLRSKSDIPTAKLMWREQVDCLESGLTFVIVSKLPKNALVEWKIIAHEEESETADFPISTSLKKIGAVKINKCENAISLVGHLDELPEDEDDWASFFWLVTKELGPVCSLTIYYLKDIHFKNCQNTFNLISRSVSLNLITVCQLESNQKATICGLSL